MQNVYSEIKKLGADLVAISGQRPEFLRQMKQKHNIEFEILRDFRSDIAAEFGLRFQLPAYLREVYLSFPVDLPRVNGEDSWTLPMPARYVATRDGTIHAADFDPDYRYRPEPQKTLDGLKEIG